MGSRNGAVAVFLDRDGVINRRRADHVKCWEEFEFLPGALQALAQLKRMELRVVVVTNQAAVGRGLIPHEELVRIHCRMTEEVANSGGRIDGIYACLHTPDAHCPCRKPGTELLRRASTELGIELGHSFTVGDSESDVLAGRAVGSQPVLIQSDGLDRGQDGLPVVRDLTEAVQIIAAATSKVGVRPF